jgi:predicted DsbA family dithiol-disulfide isomerase
VGSSAALGSTAPSPSAVAGTATECRESVHPYHDDMPETIQFSFDPRCPWCYQTSRWALRLQELERLELQWGVFSLELHNFDGDHDAFDPGRSKSAPALRTSVLVRETEGHRACGSFYAAIGRRYFYDLEDLSLPATIRGALGDVGLDPDLYEQAVGDDAVWRAVRTEHETLVEESGAFGVPTLRLDAGRGPSMFGPVIREVPSDADAIDLLTHTVWLMRSANFYELKSGRPQLPDLPYITRALAERAGASASARS